MISDEMLFEAIGSKEELETAIKVFEAIVLIEDVWALAKKNTILLKLMSLSNKVQQRKQKKSKLPKVDRELIEKIPIERQSKYLRSIAGSGSLTLEEIPMIGECMDSCSNAYNVMKNITCTSIDVNYTDHLDYLKTSTDIDSYNVGIYSSKQKRHCVICGSEYTSPHKFYHQFCLPCANFNYSKRTQTIDLSGRIAFVTGIRVKIGYEIGLKLLRSGARVIGTTRFPKDCLRRYARECDFNDWKHRITIHAIDFRNVGEVERLIAHLYISLPHLDILVNNAAQTIRRPPNFYMHLINGEGVVDSIVSSNLTLFGHFPNISSDSSSISGFPSIEYNDSSINLENIKNDVVDTTHHLNESASIPSMLSQLKLLPEEQTNELDKYFPPNKYDYFAQQIDLRPSNSWILKLSDVSPLEMLETQVINNIVPFILCSKLKALMLKSAFPDRYILNVSAMEGTFYRYKTANHPHTNMAKAALNMMTRTSAVEYMASSIYMTSIDTGWVTDERPVGFLKAKGHGDVPPPPLDELDGAMRVLDPCFMGIREGRCEYGVLFKDYKISRW